MSCQDYMKFNAALCKKMGGYFYLATVYSKWPRGIEDAWLEACRIAGWVVGQGVPVYCPIAHTHPLAIHGNLDPLDHGIWIPADRPLMHAATGLIVAQMDGWKDSYGIGVEINEFMDMNKPIFYLPWPLE